MIHFFFIENNKKYYGNRCETNQRNEKFCYLYERKKRCLRHMHWKCLQHHYDDDFEFICKCISETPNPNENYRKIIHYLLAKIDRGDYVFTEWQKSILMKYKI